MNLPVGLRGRLLALAILLIPVILVANYVVRPLVASYTAHGDILEDSRDDIARYQRLLDAAPELQSAVARLERSKPLSRYLLAGTNRALAAAGLQKQLQDAAERFGATILSLRVQNPVADGPLERISVEARLRADTKALRDLLYFIETAKPYLFVEDLSISVRQRGRRANTPGGLETRLTLHGLRIPDGPDEGSLSNG